MRTYLFDPATNGGWSQKAGCSCSLPPPMQKAGENDEDKSTGLQRLPQGVSLMAQQMDDNELYEQCHLVLGAMETIAGM